MYHLVFGGDFVVSARKLSRVVKLQLDSYIQTFQNEPFHPKLHTKPLRGKLAGSYSFRLGRDYRVIFKFIDNKTVLLLRAKHRKDVYK